ncbi:MAG TPA: hypothetical protein PK400_13485, partial [Phycisphaerales bacterium]|nr:hypothetical protein [Phycisphaerales bacterium]
MSNKRNGLMMLSAMASASAMMTGIAMANSQIETAVIDISGVVHFNPQGDAGNTKIQFNVPNGATIAIRAVGWNGTYSTFSTSWVSEAVISIADQGQPAALFVTPGVGIDQGGQNVPLSSNGLITLGSASIPNIPVFSGVVEFEFFDTFQDDPNGPEGVWGAGSTFTIQYRVVKGGACPADLNNSGAVDVQDLLILLGAWGTNPG